MYIYFSYLFYISIEFHFMRIFWRNIRLVEFLLIESIYPTMKLQYRTNKFNEFITILIFIR